MRVVHDSLCFPILSQRLLPLIRQVPFSAGLPFICTIAVPSALYFEIPLTLYFSEVHLSVGPISFSLIWSPVRSAADANATVAKSAAQAIPIRRIHSSHGLLNCSGKPFMFRTFTPVQE